CEAARALSRNRRQGNGRTPSKRPQRAEFRPFTLRTPSTNDRREQGRGVEAMTRTVAVVDYGMGNLRSVSQAVMHVAAGSGLEVVVSADPAQVMAAERVVLPGQGAMRDCMRELNDAGLKDAVLHAAATKPLL